MNTPEESAAHSGGRLFTAGAPLHEASAAMVMVHGRGADAESILMLAGELTRDGGLDHFAFLAPQAEGYSWYPYSFLAPLENNEPYLTAALASVGGALDTSLAVGIPAERTILLGFSQGACLALEFSARHARRYGGIAGLSGGLIGPEGTPRDYKGSYEGTPVFLGCSDVDFHIPRERVVETADVMRGMGAEVEMRLYPNMGHTVNRDEIAAVREMMRGV